MLVGDATQRDIHSAMAGLLLSRYQATIRWLRPTFHGKPTRESLRFQTQSDRDLVITFPTDPAIETVLSFRFIRGLDTHKIGRIIGRPHQLYFYSDWNERRGEGKTAGGRPRGHLVMSGDPPPVGAQMPSPMRRQQPQTLLLHSCAWDRPQANRSRDYYPSDYCPRERIKVTVPLEGGGSGTAQVHGGACRRRGVDLSDDQIFDGFHKQLGGVLATLKSKLPRSTKLLLRGCHSGMEGHDSTSERSMIRNDLMHMNSIIRSVAKAHCLPLINVWEVDRQSGYYSANNRGQHVAVPPSATMQAAAETLIAVL